MFEENSNHILHFDNFLAQQLFAETWLKKSLFCTGTVRQIRTESCACSNPFTMKKQDLGAFEAFGDGKVTFCQWNDKQSVCVLNNHQGVDPKASVRRWRLANKMQLGLHKLG